MGKRALFTTEHLGKALFMVLALLANLCACYYFNVGLKYIVGLIIMGWAALAFAINPDFQLIKRYIKYFLLFYFPFLLFWIWSLVIWISSFQTVDYIIRGSLNTIYMITAVGYVVGSYYLFGESAVYLNFYTMCIANTVKLVQTILASSVGQVFSEYIALVTSFASETGQAISAMELHDMAFGFGPYILFFLLYRKNGKLRLGHLLLAIFYFSLAMKRIAIAAVILPLVLILPYLKMGDGARRVYGAVLGYGGILLAFLYLWSIKAGVFYDIVDTLGINVMSRDAFYARYSSFYELAPSFLGLGVRFVYRYEEAVEGVVHQIHNIFLQMYIEVGFWTWFAWLWYEIRFRIYAIGKRVGFQGAIFLLVSTIYMWTTFTTDNTLYYWPPNVAYMYLSLLWVEKTIREKSRKEGQNLPLVGRRRLRITF